MTSERTGTDLKYTFGVQAMPKTPAVGNAEPQIAAQFKAAQKTLAGDQIARFRAAGIELIAATDANVGQNSTKPFPAFTNHVVVRIGTSIYDPSYGVVYDYDKMNKVTAAQAFEDATVGAWGVIEKPARGNNPILLLRLPTRGTTELIMVSQLEE